MCLHSPPLGTPANHDVSVRHITRHWRYHSSSRLSPTCSSSAENQDHSLRGEAGGTNVDREQDNVITISREICTDHAEKRKQYGRYLVRQDWTYMATHSKFNNTMYTKEDMATRIPITVLTGFTGCGKTTLILNLIPQLRKQDPGYKLALIKNEIGDVAVDSQLAQSAEMAATQELLGECICCVNVGQIGTALEELDAKTHPDRIIIETSGSAEPLKLVLEIKRLAEATGRYELDGIVSVIDAENWGGYASKSYTAKLQAKQTDLIVINKWEGLSERDYDIFLDKLGDLDVDTPQVKSDKGWVEKNLLFGFDELLARNWLKADSHDHDHDHADGEKHTSEVECLSVTLQSPSGGSGVVDLAKLEALLKAAPKDEVYRIKGVIYSASSPKNQDGKEVRPGASGRGRYILNWSFGRWTWYSVADEDDASYAPVARLSIFTAPYESTKWSKKAAESVKLAAGAEGALEVKRVQ